MDLFYIIVFGGLAALAGALEFTKPADLTAVKNADFRRFRNNYLLVYSLMMGEDLPMIPPPHPSPTPPDLECGTKVEDVIIVHPQIIIFNTLPSHLSRTLTDPEVSSTTLPLAMSRQ